MNFEIFAIVALLGAVLYYFGSAMYVIAFAGIVLLIVLIAAFAYAAWFVIVLAMVLGIIGTRVIKKGAIQ